MQFLPLRDSVPNLPFQRPSGVKIFPGRRHQSEISKFSVLFGASPRPRPQPSDSLDSARQVFNEKQRLVLPSIGPRSNQSVELRAGEESRRRVRNWSQTDRSRSTPQLSPLMPVYKPALPGHRLPYFL